MSKHCGPQSLLEFEPPDLQPLLKVTCIVFTFVPELKQSSRGLSATKPRRGIGCPSYLRLYENRVDSYKADCGEGVGALEVQSLKSDAERPLGLEAGKPYIRATGTPYENWKCRDMRSLMHPQTMESWR